MSTPTTTLATTLTTATLVTTPHHTHRRPVVAAPRTARALRAACRQLLSAAVTLEPAGTALMAQAEQQMAWVEALAPDGSSPFVLASVATMVRAVRGGLGTLLAGLPAGHGVLPVAAPAPAERHGAAPAACVAAVIGFPDSPGAELAVEVGSGTTFGELDETVAAFAVAREMKLPEDFCVMIAAGPVPKTTDTLGSAAAPNDSSARDPGVAWQPPVLSVGRRVVAPRPEPAEGSAETRVLLLTMVRMEAAARGSDAMQKRFKGAGDGWSKALDVSTLSICLLHAVDAAHLAHSPFALRPRRAVDLCAEEQDRIVEVATGWPTTGAGSHLHRKWLEYLRNAHLMFPSVPEFKELPVQVKQNRRGEGLPLGTFGDCTLHTQADLSKTVRLSEIVSAGPTVVIGGSMT